MAHKDRFDEKGRPVQIAIPGRPNFGMPVLLTGGVGTAKWTKEHFRYGNYTAELFAGAQTGYNDFAMVSVPVNDIPLGEIYTMEYVYRMGVTEELGPNICIHVFDPADPDNRADISYSNGATTLPRAAGWNKFKIPDDPTDRQWFYYGNNIPTTTGLTAGGGSNLYYLDQYKKDAVFSTYVVSRIDIEWGYGHNRTMGVCNIGKFTINGVDIPMGPSLEEQFSELKDETAKALTTIPTWTFGEPSLVAEGNGKAMWDRGTDILGTNQKGNTGWVAKLVGGVQSGWDDAASVVIPVNEVPVPEFNSALWTYYLHNAQLHGLNIGIHVHDPTDNDKRGDISQSGAAVLLAKAAGWNAHELNPATAAQFFYYAENIDGLSGLTTGPANLYSWAQFQADKIFSTWTIYKITINQGYYTGDGVFGDAIVADIKLNGQVIPLKPSASEMWYSDHNIKNDIPLTSAIYTPRRIHVQPVFANYSTTTDQQGIGHLVRGGYGLAAGAGGNVDLGIGYLAHLQARGNGTDVCSFGFPLNIPVNKLDTLTFLEKCKTASKHQPNISFRLDASRSGAWRHEAGTSTTSMQLVDYHVGDTGSSTAWAIMTPLADTTWQLKNWHTRIATPDAAIAADAVTQTFALYKATDIGDYYIKEVVFAYSGETDDWAKIGSLVINGVEYVFDLADSQKIQHFYCEHASGVIAKTCFPQTPFRLLGIDIHLSDVLATGELITITLDSGLGIDGYHDTMLFSEDLFVGSRKSYHGVFGAGYEFTAVDHLDIALSANSLNRNVGIDVTYEIL